MEIARASMSSAMLKRDDNCLRCSPSRSYDLLQYVTVYSRSTVYCNRRAAARLYVVCTGRMNRAHST